uniref:Cytochrome P450 CYP302A1 n=1 Tax=Helicoverpa armigera TaxID=29058 RepID=A0A068ETR0_HELAM|nr:cytochrome P450 CYP302A1 [Helicoverpa armigera]
MLKLSKKYCGHNKSLSFASNVASYSDTIEVHNGRGNVKSFEEIPGPKSYPVVGTLYKYMPFIGDYNVEALDKNAWLNYRRYGNLVRETPGVNLLHVYDPEDIETVFRQDHRYPARRSHVAMYHYRTNKPHVYNTGGLLSTNGPEWWRLRSTFQKNFTSPQSVKNHIESTDSIVTEFVQWLKQINITHNEDFLPYLNRLNLEVIATVAFNERFNSFSSEEQDLNSRSSKTIAAAFGSNSGIMKLDKGFMWKLFKTPLYKQLADSQEYLEKVSTEILLERVHFFKHADNNDVSLLGSFLQQPNLDLKDVVGMMVDILMAAIDTTAYTTSFALYHISRNPEVQQKMFDEILQLLPTKDTRMSSEIVSKAVYVRSCIKESLRLNPVSIGVGRLTQKEFILRDYLIPKGTVIVTQNMVSSRLQQYVKDPFEFKPERWLRGSTSYENIHPFLSLPFGFGPRSCIARRLAEQNICIILVRLIREYNLKWIGGELGVQTLLINKPDKPVTLSFTPRNL